jgi:hypothetical protein
MEEKVRLVLKYEQERTTTELCQALRRGAGDRVCELHVVEAAQALSLLVKEIDRDAGRSRRCQRLQDAVQ